MKKSILSLGTALNRAEQKTINGGNNPWGCPESGDRGFCSSSADCLDPTVEDDGMGTWICEMVFGCGTGNCTVV